MFNLSSNDPATQTVSQPLITQPAMDTSIIISKLLLLSTEPVSAVLHMLVLVLYLYSTIDPLRVTSQSRDWTPYWRTGSPSRTSGTVMEVVNSKKLACKVYL